MPAIFEVTDDDLLRLDRQFAEMGIPFHARPLRAALELLGPDLLIAPSNETTARINEAYRRLVPEVNTTWPGMGVGLAASVDRVRRVTLAVAFGTVRVSPEQLLGFGSRQEWIQWCRGDPLIAAKSCFAAADLHDLTYGMDDLEGVAPEAAMGLWRLALSNLEDVANILSTGYSISSVLQPICMVAELSMKGTLLRLGVSESELRSRSLGHSHRAIAERLSRECPHRDDTLVTEVADRLPDYVQSRYQGSGMTRLKVVELALGVQFLAASALRRISSIDLAQQMESESWPGPRRALFIE